MEGSGCNSLLYGRRIGRLAIPAPLKPRSFRQMQKSESAQSSELSRGFKKCGDSGRGIFKTGR